MSAAELSAMLKGQGILIGAYGPTRMRAVTHLDVDRDGIETALRTLRRVLS
jgi:threonine aldolase